MQEHKQRAIDLYGHFYVLCVTHDDPNDPYMGNTAKGLDEDMLMHSWRKSGLVPRFIIKEFLGDPRDAYLVENEGSVFRNLYVNGRMNENCCFQILGLAKAKAEKLQKECEPLFEKLRKAHKTLEGVKDRTDRLVTIDEELLPETIPYASLCDLQLGKTIYRLDYNVNQTEMVVEPSQIRDAQLTISQLNNTPFSYEYRVKISSPGIRKTIAIDPVSGESTYSVSDHVQVFVTEEKAREAAQEMAKEIYQRIEAFLPSPSTPSTAPSSDTTLNASAPQPR